MDVPDFDMLAREALKDVPSYYQSEEQLVALALRRVWNLRGEADKRAATVAMMYLMGTASAPFYCEKIDREIDELNR